MAARISRSDPCWEIGLIPIAEGSGKRICFTPISRRRKSITLRASGLPAPHSMPEYTSSVFSRKITMSTFSGCFTGEGAPLNSRTGRGQTYRSSSWRRVTLRLRNPSPRGALPAPWGAPAAGGVDAPDGGTPDVGAGAVPLDERDDRVVGNPNLSVLDGDLLSGRDFHSAQHHRAYPNTRRMSGQANHPSRQCSITTRGSPPSNFCPGETQIVLIVPFTRARMGVSIFKASMSQMRSPSLTAFPTWT